MVLKGVAVDTPQPTSSPTGRKKYATITKMTGEVGSLAPDILELDLTVRWKKIDVSLQFVQNGWGQGEERFALGFGTRSQLTTRAWI